MAKTPIARLSMKLFVGSLPGDSTTEEIYTYFQDFGTVVNVVMFYRDHRLPCGKQLNRGFCHVEVADADTASDILAQAKHVFKGRHIQCAAYKSGDSLKITNKHNDDTRIMLKGLPHGVTESELKTKLDKFGPVKYAYLIPSKAGTTHKHRAPKVGSFADCQTASVQFYTDIPVKVLLSSSAVVVRGTVIKVERYVHNHRKTANRKHENQELSMGKKTEQFLSPAESVYSRSKMCRNNFIGEAPFPTSSFFKGKLSSEHIYFMSNIKPTSSLFINAGITSNHENHTNLLFKVLGRNPDIRYQTD